MADKKYSGYSVEELVGDQEFVSMVKRIEKKEEWEQFLQSYPASQKNIVQARKIILLFRTNDGALSNEKKYKLWKNICRFDQEYSRKHKIARINILTKVAASVLVIVSLGSVLYMGLTRNIQEYQFSALSDQLQTQSPLLVLSNGQQVNLGKDESSLTVLENQNAIQINNDSIINNHPAIDKTPEEALFNEVIVPFGKKSKLVLGDGTKVWLNAGTRFAFPQKFDGKTREVFLEGEGYFEVARNESQAFILSANNVKIEVLGTKFNVSAYRSDNFIETVLLEGSVRLSDKGRLFPGSTLMAPNQKATYNKIQKEIELKPEPNPKTYTAWVEGWYQFSNENLEQVFTKLERYYNVTFAYDPSLISTALPVSGKLYLKGSLSEVMAVLSGVAKINYQIIDKEVIITIK